MTVPDPGSRSSRDLGDRQASLEVERAAFSSDQEPAIAQAIREEEGSFALVTLEEGALAGEFRRHPALGQAG